MEEVLEQAERAFAFVERGEEEEAGLGEEEGPSRVTTARSSSSGSEVFLDAIREEQIGRLAPIETPFGTRPLVYADWTASARALGGVEDFVRHRVLPLYGNTHTATSVTGAQSTAFVEEARRLVGEFAGARTTGKAALDVVLFCGSGATAATCRLVSILGLDHKKEDSIAPVVFVGPYEHHSNLLPWRESRAVVVSIGPSAAHGVDLVELEEKIKEHAHRPLKIGAFNASSNVTGRKTDVDAVTRVLKRHGALSCWDYATLAAHEAPQLTTAARHLDAVSFSCHKLLGGVGAPGILVVKKALIDSSNVPSEPGGGTVFYVTRDAHRYLSNRVEREQGGTPDIVGAARAGLATLLGRAIECDKHDDRRASIVKRLEGSGFVTVLRTATGPAKGDLPILPLLVGCGGGRWLHYNFVCVLLNDLFGVQCRGGCQCAGPYAQELLGLTAEASELLESALLTDKNNEILRPGFTRLSLASSSAFASAEETEYVLKALELVAELGWRALPLYRAETRTGEWRHRSRLGKPLGQHRRWLSSVLQKGAGGGGGPFVVTADDNSSTVDFGALLKEGEARLLACAVEKCGGSSLEEAFEPLRWFLTPAEAAEAMKRDPQARSFPQEGITGPLRPPMALAVVPPWDPREAKEALQAHASALALKKADAKRPRRLANDVEEAAPVLSKEDDDHLMEEAVTVVVDEPVVASAEVAPAVTEEKLLPKESMKRPLATSPVSKAAVKRARALPKKLLKCVGEAVRDWKMIEEGDRILVGLSGGKDSLSMLHVLLDLQRRAPVSFEIACCTVDPATPSFDPTPLIPYLEGLGVRYFYLRDNIIPDAERVQPTSLCAYCARMKRGALYTCANSNGFNKLALGQHLDDLAESFLMGALHNGQLRTMRAKYLADRGVTVIRPLAYAREHMTADFAKQAGLPVINENCPACFEEPKERARIKKLLSREEALYPNMYSSLKKAMVPLMDDRVYAAMATNDKPFANHDDAALEAELERRKQQRQQQNNKSPTGEAQNGNTDK